MKKSEPFWRKKFSEKDIKLLIREIQLGRSLSAEGKVTFQGDNDLDGWLAILASAIDLNISNNALRRKISRDVIFSSELPIDFTEADFRSITHKLLNIAQENARDVYRVVFPVWNLPKFLNKIFRIGPVNLNFSPSRKNTLFRNILIERDSQLSDQRFKTFFTQSKLRDLRCCSVCVAHVRAGSPEEAYEKASLAMYGILGRVNLAADGGKYSRSSFRILGTLPISEVLIGPHITTHFEDGKLAWNGFWHEDWTGGPKRRLRVQKEVTEWEGLFLKLSGGIANSLWRDDCMRAAAGYYKAFSKPDMEECFLDGWRLFESIAGGRYEKTETLLVRASNIFEDNQEHLILGRHLAVRRNSLTHGHAIEINDEETLAYQMLRFLVPLLERFLINGFNFRDKREFWEFLDLPSEKNDRFLERQKLENRLNLLKKAAEFRGEGD